MAPSRGDISSDLRLFRGSFLELPRKTYSSLSGPTRVGEEPDQYLMPKILLGMILG